MAELWLQVVPLRAADGPPLVHAMHEKMVRAEISGLEKRLEIDPVNAPLHDDAAVLYAEIGRLDRAAAHFAETARLTPDSAAAHYNLGNALFQQGRRVEAAAQLREAVALRPGYALAHDGLGVALYAEGRTNEAIGEFERASERARSPQRGRARSPRDCASACRAARRRHRTLPSGARDRANPRIGQSRAGRRGTAAGDVGRAGDARRLQGPAARVLRQKKKHSVSVVSFGGCSSLFTRTGQVGSLTFRNFKVPLRF
jgi:tetratricopeptide (TPR) repeat protein